MQYAHSVSGQPLEQWQTLDAHLLGVAKLAENFASTFQSSDWAWNAAWLHDIGKAANEFQMYLRRENGILDDVDYDSVGCSKVNHSSAGAALAEEIFEPIAGKTMAYIVAGHHAGLPDFDTANAGRAALLCRLEEGRKDLSKIRSIILAYESNIKKNVTRPPSGIEKDNFHLWVRMLFSCLVDADFLDTEYFMNPMQSSERGVYKSINELKVCFDDHMHKKTANAQSTPVNLVRKKVLLACRDAAMQSSGLFSLTVPTGGGKTLSGMAFAIDHAVMHAKNRIIYVIPYTSIIEQTASILADIFGKENVVEHHSNLDPERETKRSCLASENWDAPIIITTNVQFFESLYSAKSGRCRKLHNIANSIVILDEAQLLPPELLTPCVDVINQLTRHYSVTVLLSTATQPSLPQLDASKEIIKDPVEIYQQLKRTEIILPSDINNCKQWSDIAELLQKHHQVLCIVNTRKDCRELFDLMPSGAIHLSALMCGEHRSQVIHMIKQRLKDGLPMVVVSTQLVEAGVDIDFPVVYRALSGLDSIAQASGRCNREGKLNAEGKLGCVYVFIPPKRAPRGLLRKGEDKTRELISLHDIDFQNPKEFTHYFNLFYSSVNDTGSGFKDLLVRDVPNVQFRTAGREFRLIDDSGQQPVFVKFGESRKWLDELRCIGPNRNNTRRLQRFTVNLSKADFDKAQRDGLIEEVWQNFWLWIGRYDNERGLDLFGSYLEAEDLVI